MVQLKQLRPGLKRQVRGNLSAGGAKRKTSDFCRFRSLPRRPRSITDRTARSAKRSSASQNPVYRNPDPISLSSKGSPVPLKKLAENAIALQSAIDIYRTVITAIAKEPPLQPQPTCVVEERKGARARPRGSAGEHDHGDTGPRTPHHAFRSQNIETRTIQNTHKQGHEHEPRLHTMRCEHVR